MPSASARASKKPPASGPGQRARARAVDGARRLQNAFGKVVRAVRGHRRDEAWAAYLVVRREYRRIEPVAWHFAPVAASQIEPGREEPDERPTAVGLRDLGDALLVDPIDWQAAERIVEKTRRAVRVVARELETASFTDFETGHALSLALFEWGARLDGSIAEHEDEARIDAFDAARFLVDYCRLFEAAAPRKPSAGPLGEAIVGFEEKLARLKKSGHGKLGALRASGRLGGALRSAVFALTERRPRAPFPPMRASGSASPGVPVSVATFPALRGKPPDRRHVALGATLFFDPRLSRGGKLSCADCHRVENALSGGPRRALDVDGKPVARDSPPLWNVAYDPMFFWDGRASSLDRQIEIAVERDMGGSWEELTKKLAGDDELSARFREAFPGGMAPETVRAALAAFERVLVADDTPFDRFVRGEDDAMTDEMQRGFDVFYGKARCSRCHRLPLTSGTRPPRFSVAEVSAIGVPTAPRRKKLDPDRGRAGVSGAPRDEHAFKVPTLRNLAVTAPYFHNGSHRTLEEVVDFYADGSGRGLGFELPSFDPDANAFEIEPAERAALVVFLRDGLRDDRAQSTKKAIESVSPRSRPPSRR